VLTQATCQKNGLPATAPRTVTSGAETLSARRCLQIYRLMVRSRALEEQLITMCRSGEGCFWVGGPGEEAFNVCLGLQVKKGCGPAYDYLHLHYRSSATLLAMGMLPIDAIRQMAMTAADPHSRGRNFVGHFARREWNVIPVSSIIEMQYAIASGTALVQKRHGGDGVTIVVGGDAGTAEGDFASCLVWSTRPGHELPVLLVVTHNGWGVSTPASSQHGEAHMIDRGKAFGVPGELVDGNDPVASWHAIRRALDHCRRQRAPYMLEARVSRLYGHTSGTGARRVQDEADCIDPFQQKLIEAGLVQPRLLARAQQAARAEMEAAAQRVPLEPQPTADHLCSDTYAPSSVDQIYPVDYFGLPD
jgi:2-oxoisovalerate dehydrogenase E1 component alpha subunit